MYITKDTRCEESKQQGKKGQDTRSEESKLQQKKCKDFLHLVKKEIATKIRSLLQKYASDEWATRER
jgi:hypothetical protein